MSKYNLLQTQNIRSKKIHSYYNHIKDCNTNIVLAPASKWHFCYSSRIQWMTYTRIQKTIAKSSANSSLGRTIPPFLSSVRTLSFSEQEKKNRNIPMFYKSCPTTTAWMRFQHFPKYILTSVSLQSCMRGSDNR